MQATVSKKKQVVRRTFEALSERDFDAFKDFHTGDAVLHDGREDVQGIDAIIDHERELIEAFPDLEYAIQTMIEDGEWIALRHTATGTHEQELQGIEPTGVEVEIPVLMLMRFEGDKLAEIWLQADQLGLLQQLGVMEARTP